MPQLRRNDTHFVSVFAFWQFNRLLEDAVFFVELDSLLPVVEVASDEDFVGGMRPGMSKNLGTGPRPATAVGQRTT